MNDLFTIIAEVTAKTYKDNNIKMIAGDYRLEEYPDNGCIRLDGWFSIKELKLIAEIAVETKKRIEEEKDAG